MSMGLTRERATRAAKGQVRDANSDLISEHDHSVGGGARLHLPYSFGTVADVSVGTSPVNLVPVAGVGQLRIQTAGNLTGTVSKTNASATLTGVGTLFTTELGVGAVVSVPGGGGTDVLVVKAIASNTSLTVFTAPTHTAATQTVAKVPSAIGVSITGHIDEDHAFSFHFSALTGGLTAGTAQVRLLKNGSEVAGSKRVINLTTANVFLESTVFFEADAGDYLQIEAVSSEATRPFSLVNFQLQSLGRQAA